MYPQQQPYSSSSFGYASPVSPTHAPMHMIDPAAQAQISQLQQELQAAHARNNALQAQNRSMQPPPLPPQTSSSHSRLNEERRRRTDARNRVFCSTNRNGISSCAWHLTRNKPKEHAPRQAPSGFLNCGCSQKETLFEDSLARNGIGSVTAGEERVHPIIRRAMLAKLEQRYGYVDGDFEIDLRTGTWFQGQDPNTWEQTAQGQERARRR
ncbi:hypothetical protein BKA62DRAFT_262861 [Auriculariales sp. MPI-PUGE-AT-0066]|nr:hypothetical protein BKA62DRAFT_262861 [Auriculariales sp. MPI-PUGE-AT-0066]